jgi:hypothetical protein
LGSQRGLVNGHTLARSTVTSRTWPLRRSCTVTWATSPEHIPPRFASGAWSGPFVVHEHIDREFAVLGDQCTFGLEGHHLTVRAQDAPKLPSSKPVSVPSVRTLARTAIRAARSWTKTSVSKLPSPATRLSASKVNATNRRHRGTPVIYRAATRLRHEADAMPPDRTAPDDVDAHPRRPGVRVR